MATEYLLAVPSEYETNSLNSRKEPKLTFTIQINFIPWP
jgi:hypothetical protein